MRVVLSLKAERDLAGIYTFSLRNWGEAQAEKYQSSIFSTLDLLIESPRVGRRIPSRIGDVRVLRTEQHRAYYRVLDDQIWVVRVMHPKQLLDLDNDGT